MTDVNTVIPPTISANPGISSADLGISSADPGISSADPGISSADPGISSADPGVNSADPGVNSADPGISSADPGISSADPGVNSADPGINSADPGINSATEQTIIVDGYLIPVDSQVDTDIVPTDESRLARQNASSSDLELLESTYSTLVVMAHGLNITSANWILLLTKSMYIVSQLKLLSSQEKIELSVQLVIKYLDDFTDIDDNLLIIIRSSVMDMCISMLDNIGTLKKKPATTKTTDPDMLASPSQIIELLIKRLITIIKSRTTNNPATENSNVSWFISALPELTLTLIATVDKFTHLTGLEKKNLIISAFQKLIKEHAIALFPGLTTEQISQLNLMLDSIPFIIDTLVNVARGKQDYKFIFDNPAQTLGFLKKLTQLFSTCCSGCKSHV